MEEAAATPTAGWDFAWLGERMSVVTSLSWDFAAMATDAFKEAKAALDLGTGGGEFLSERPVLPALTAATESWTPNVAVAARRLAPRGVTVMHTEAAIDNHQQRDRDPKGRLPFADACFDLVVSRHEAFVASEVARVLAPEGTFLTQQANSAKDQFCVLLGLRPRLRAALDLDLLVGQVRETGLEVAAAATGVEEVRFADIGALAWYLRMVPWAVPGFDILTHRQALEAASSCDLTFYQERFWLRCRR